MKFQIGETIKLPARNETHGQNSYGKIRRFTEDGRFAVVDFETSEYPEYVTVEDLDDLYEDTFAVAVTPRSVEVR